MICQAACQFVINNFKKSHKTNINFTQKELFFRCDDTACFVDTVCGDNASDAACGVYAGISSYDCAGVEDAVAAHLNEITEHCAYFLDTCYNFFTV